MTVIIGIIIFFIILGLLSGVVEALYTSLPFLAYVLRFGVIALVIYFIYRYIKTKDENSNDNKYMAYIAYTFILGGVFFFTNTPAEKIAKEPNDVEVATIDESSNEEALEETLEEPEPVDEEISEEEIEDEQAASADKENEEIEQEQEKDTDLNTETYDMLNGFGTEKIGKSSVTRISQSEVTDEFLQNWYNGIKELNTNYDIIVYQETLNSQEPRGVYHNGGIIYKDVPLIPDTPAGTYSLGDISEDTEMFYPEK